jgi:hypothetical protein
MTPYAVDRLSRRGLTIVAAGLAVAFSNGSHARITRIVVDQVESPTANGQSFGTVGQYEKVSGRAFGEVDPADRRNAIVQDIELAPRNPSGKVEYVATFSLTRPIDAGKASGVLLYSVVNRGNGAPTPGAQGHVSVVSGWQGDLLPLPSALTTPQPFTQTNQTLRVPIAVNRDGSPVTGPFLVRFVNVSGSTGAMGNPFGGPTRYPPLTLETAKATLTSRASERLNGGTHGPLITIASTDWAFADCRTVPFPGTSDPTRVCLRNGFDPALLYELVYTARDPFVLGLGLAATRDLVSFLRYAANDDFGTANPAGAAISHAVSTGVSQSGNLIKTFIHLGFNEDESGRMVWDGAFPIIAARQTPINFRFAIPGGAAGINEPGSEPFLWWNTYLDAVRGRRAGSMLDRCSATRTCPKIVEGFGSTEFWDLRMSPALVGTDATRDIPLPSNVRRYYFPGTNHGGGRGGFDPTPSPAPGCLLASNPNPESDTLSALTVALVDWVVKRTEPPQSRYPTLRKRLLVEDRKEAVGFPDIPGVPWTDDFVNAVLDYDLGPRFIYDDMSGIISNEPPAIEQVVTTLVPRVDQDGNEIASGGVASVLFQAPLGTYLGWNIRATGFYKGQICDFTGGYAPFAKTKAERLANDDPRLSLAERYGTKQGYLCLVRRAAKGAVAGRYLLQTDSDRIVAQATAASGSFLPDRDASTTSREAKATGELLCRGDDEQERED